MHSSTSNATTPSCPLTRIPSIANSTALNAAALAEATFIEQLFAAPSQIMPDKSPVILQIALQITERSCFLESSQAIPTAAPIQAVIAAQSADNLGKNA